MSKTQPLKQDEQVAAPPKLSLTEFCQRTSQTMTRPELLGSFEYVERQAKRLADTDAAYKERLDQFLNKPI